MVEVTCVMGVCAPERLKTVVAVSLAVGAEVVDKLPQPGDADELAAALEPQLVAWLTSRAHAVVVEAPELTRPTELLAAFERLRRDYPGRFRLRGLITSVDPTHLSADLEDRSYVVVESPENLGAEPLEARAQIVVDQIEFADVLVVSTARHPSMPATGQLLRALAPTAQILPLRRGAAFVLPEDRGVEHDASGWMQLLTEPPVAPPEQLAEDAVGAFVYSHVRPFHPRRLLTLLEGSVERGVFGTVIRSAGFCRFSTRPERSAQWSHVGHMIDFSPLPADADSADDGDLLAVGQEIAIIGYGLNARSLSNALDSCTLTDEEFAAGPESWRAHPDALPRWILEDDQTGR